MREITLAQFLLGLVLVVLIGAVVVTSVDPNPAGGLPVPAITDMEVVELEQAAPRTAIANVELRKLSPAPAPEIPVTFALHVDDGSSAAPLTATLTALAEPAGDDAPCEWSCFTATVTFDEAYMPGEGFAGFDRIEVTAATTSGADAEPVQTTRTFFYSTASATFVTADSLALALDTSGLTIPGGPNQAPMIESCSCLSAGNELRARLPFRRRFPTLVEIDETPLVGQDLDGDGLRDGVCVELQDPMDNSVASVEIAVADLASQPFHARGPAAWGAFAEQDCVQFGRLDEALNCVAAGFRAPDGPESEDCLRELDPDCEGTDVSAAFAVSLRATINGVPLSHDGKITVFGDTACTN